ncbi:uncharacterized protein [Asterias amurensis]|uniref:uncharacterized protein n=1 Tax=Asterias amurensis TaxID=7602 RepID=UPI003AB2CCEA
MLRFDVTALFFLAWILPASGVDLTATPGATGPEVVEATVQRILLSDIFTDDFDLLRRIALVETSDGTDPVKFADGLAGGIWRLRKDAFIRTKELYLSPEDWGSYYWNIQESGFKIDWRAITYEDLQVPYISALAARIYVMMTSEHPDSVPYALLDQMVFWKTNYNHNGNATQFVEKVREFEDKQICITGVDVVFMLDASLSVGEEGFARSKSFVRQVVEAFNIGPNDDQTSVGCLQFSHEVTVAFDLGDHDNKEDILKAVDDISYSGGGTALGKVIDFIRQSSFTEEHGARRLEYAVPRIAIIVTDGKTNKEFPVLYPSALAHSDGIMIYCIGVGDANEEELSIIASRPASSHVLHVRDYQAIEYLRNIVASRTCKESTSVAVGQPILTDLEDGEARFVSYQIDAEEGATLKFMTSSGLVTIYLSSEVPNPNEAVHDYKLETDGRTDVFIDPGMLGFGNHSISSRRKRSPSSQVTLFTAIYAHGNGTQLYVESSTGNTADPAFPPAPLSPTTEVLAPGDSGQAAPQLGDVPSIATKPSSMTEALSLFFAVVCVAVVNLKFY